MEDEVGHHGKDRLGTRIEPLSSEICDWKPASPPKGDMKYIWQVPLDDTIVIH